ncbi:MAG: hypothetical protein V4484_03030 [Pseudomonadota bacterium]
MQSRTDGPLYLLLAVVALGEFVDGYWHARSLPAPPLWSVLNAFLFSYTAFVWYCRDSDAHAYRRSLLRNIGFIFFSIAFVPYYLVRSRARGQKWRALLRLAGYLFLMLTAAATGAFLIALVAA